MKELRITLTDENKEKLTKDKEDKECTWRDYLKLGYVLTNDNNVGLRGEIEAKVLKMVEEKMKGGSL